jgi:hypothetical protein
MRYPHLVEPCVLSGDFQLHAGHADALGVKRLRDDEFELQVGQVAGQFRRPEVEHRRASLQGVERVRKSWPAGTPGGL